MTTSKKMTTSKSQCEFVTYQKYGINYTAWKSSEANRDYIRWFGPSTLGELERGLIKVWFHRDACVLINDMRDLQGKAPGRYNQEKAVGVFHGLINATWFSELDEDGKDKHEQFVRDINLYLSPMNACITSEGGLSSVIEILKNPTSVGERFTKKEIEELIAQAPDLLLEEESDDEEDDTKPIHDRFLTLLSETKDEIVEEMNQQESKDFIVMRSNVSSPTLWIIKNLEPAIQELITVGKILDEEPSKEDNNNNNNNNKQ